MNRPFWRFPALLAMGALLALSGVAAGTPVVTITGNLGAPLILDTQTMCDVNNIALFVTNAGGFARDLQSPGGPSGFFFPKGTDKTAVYAAGLWFGSHVQVHVPRGAGLPDSVYTDTRVTVAEYSLEYQPGTCHYDTATHAMVWDDPGSSLLRSFKLVKGDTESQDYQDYLNVAAKPESQGGQGAPLVNGAPLIYGDQTIWGVYNDANEGNHSNQAGSSLPQNIEVKQTTFGFDRGAPLGNMVFIRWKFYNRGVDTLRDCYASFWSDPDLGGANDDLVGCDTLLSTGFVYNSGNSDEIYGATPPCVGYRFFQGPVVPGAPGDSAITEGRWIHGFKNLPMTSFNKYINGTDPNSKNKSYNYMKGLNADGTPLIDETTHLVTTYAHSGDPVAGTGWLDPTAADKRLQLSSGPFIMVPGDSQEVVVGMIVGQGTDRLSSLTLMKTYAVQAKAVFDANFALASPPPRPTLYVVPGEKSVDLIWGMEAVDNVSRTEALHEEFHFEGYNLYQSASIAGPWKKIFTWDIADSMTTIYGDVFDATVGGQQRVIQQTGTNNGLVQKVHLTQDYIRGGPLSNYAPYYYSLTAYSYDVGIDTLRASDNSIISITPHTTPFYIGVNKVGHISPNLENSKTGVEVQPKASSAVLDIHATHAGASDASADIVMVRPDLVPAGEFDIKFREDPADATKLVWDLIQTGTVDTLLKAQTYQANPDYYGYPVVHGMMVRVLAPAPGLKRTTEDYPMIDEIKGADGAAVPPDGKGGPGKAVWHHRNSTRDWLISAGGGGGGEDRFNRNNDYGNMDSRDIIIKFDNDPNNIGWWYYDTVDYSGWGPVPFGMYQHDPLTGTDTRVVPKMYGLGAAVPFVFDYAADGEADPYTGWPATDRIYPITFSGDWAALVSNASGGTVTDPTLQGQLDAGAELFSRMFFCSPNDPPTIPPTGTEIQFSTTKPPTLADSFHFTSAPGQVAGTAVGYDLSKITAVPNPYLNQSKYELNQFNRILKFINVPNKPTTIRIFDLAGDLVRTLEKTDANSSEVIWDLLNKRQIPVASGIYIYSVDVKGVGRHTGKVAVFVEKERLNRF